MNGWKWFLPGLRIKRWVAVIALGALMLSLGAVFIMGKNIPREFYLLVTSYVRQGVFGISLSLLGITFIIYGVRRLNGRVIGVFMPDGGNDKLIDRLYEEVMLSKGIKIVVLGGGTGLHSLLRGLKEYTSNITAIVTVSDDGGSSGRLRDELNILPPGDIRQCIAALAPSETSMIDLFSSRFHGEGPLKGHSVGNLLLAAMTELKHGDFNLAVQELSKVLNVRGRVLPSTVQNVTLCAEMENGLIVTGESSITADPAKINRVFLSPADARALPEAVSAIIDADIVVIGPGSLFTSIMPNLLVKDLLNAVRRTRATRVYVCNVMTQPGETDGFTAADHASRVIKLTGRNSIDHIVVNKKYPSRLLARYEAEGARPVKVDRENIARLGIRNVIAEDLVREDELVRHDPDKLAACVMRIARDELKAAGPAAMPFDLEKLREKLMNLGG